MNMLLRMLAIALTIALAMTACGEDDDAPLLPVAEEPTSEPTAVPAPEPTAKPTAVPVKLETDALEAGERLETLWVGPQLVECVGVIPQQCMLVRQTKDGQPEYFYDQIEGFEHELGVTYVLRVGVSDVENPPADASSLRYRLIEIVEAVEQIASDQIDGTTWRLLGVRDGDLFDAVPDDVEINIGFADGQASGSAGCNRFMSTYTADGTDLAFSPVGATKMLCPPEVMVHEDRFLTMLAEVDTVEITFDDRLMLTTSAGLSLVFAPA